PDAGGRDRHGGHPYPDRVDGALAHGDARHPDGRDARGGAGGRGDGAPPLHRALQQLLADRRRALRDHAADRLARRPHLQLRRHALRDPARAARGGRARPRPAGAGHEPRRPEPPPAPASPDLGVSSCPPRWTPPPAHPPPGTDGATAMATATPTWSSIATSATFTTGPSRPCVTPTSPS